MDLPAIIKAVPAPRTERGSPSALSFRPGDRLAGKVLQVERDGRTLMDLGGTRVLARLGFDVSQGQSLKLTVVDKGPPLHLRADLPDVQPGQAPVQGSNTFSAMPVPRSDPAGRGAIHFRAGEMLEGKVAQLESDGRVLIDVGGSRVSARLGFPVQQGRVLKLTVVQGRPPLLFRVDSQDERPPWAGSTGLPSGLTGDERRELRQTLKVLLPRLTARSSVSSVPRGVVDALRQINAAVDFLPMDKPAGDIAHWLRNALENHGGLFEKKLADIEKGVTMPRADTATAAAGAPETPVRAVITRDVKPQLIILKNFLSGADGDPAVALKSDDRSLAPLRGGVDKMLQHLEQQQERVLARAGEGEPFQVFGHSLPLEEHRPPVQLKVYYPPKSDREGQCSAHRVALLLDMDQLGWVRGDIAQTADGLQIRFYVRDQDVMDLFHARSHEITAALQDRFDRVRVEVSVSAEKIAQFHHEDVPGAAAGRIDIKA